MGTQLLIIIYFFISWMLYLAFQALFINGIKLAAMGTTEILPDGTERDGEMILYPLAKELLKTKKVQVFYQDEQLAQFYAIFIANFPGLAGGTLDNFRLNFVNDTQRDNYQQSMPQFKKNANMASQGIQVQIGATCALFYKEYNDYVYSKWIRKPVIQCIICMASFWGLFTFLLPALALTNFNLWMIPAYVVNTVALGTVNKIFYKTVQ